MIPQKKMSAFISELNHSARPIHIEVRGEVVFATVDKFDREYERVGYSLEEFLPGYLDYMECEKE